MQSGHQVHGVVAQEEEERTCTAAGYRRLHELRLLKAAAARLVYQPDAAGTAQHHQPHSFSFSGGGGSSSSISSLGPLMRSFSNIEHVMPQRLSRASSTDRSSVSSTPAVAGLPPRLGRSNSAGATKLAAFLPQPSPQVLAQPSSMRAAVSAAPSSSRFEPVTQGGRAPRYSEPISAGGVLGPDDRVELLLAEVEVLLAERQQLSARVHGLQKDNDQLAELVGRLTRTLQEQEFQIQEQDLQIQQLQQQQSSSYLGPLPSLALPQLMGTARLGPASQPAVLHPSLQQQQQHLEQRQVRVDEWRQETWQQWQERLPLEHMHSGSSSTLTVSLDQP